MSARGKKGRQEGVKEETEKKGYKRSQGRLEDEKGRGKDDGRE